MEKVLKDFPPRIEDVYQQTWQRICDESSENVLIGKSALLWVLCAKRPLKIDELRLLLATCDRTHKFDPSRMIDAQALVMLCRGLLVVEAVTDNVRFVRE